MQNCIFQVVSLKVNCSPDNPVVCACRRLSALAAAVSALRAAVCVLEMLAPSNSEPGELTCTLLARAAGIVAVRSGEAWVTLQGIEETLVTESSAGSHSKVSVLVVGLTSSDGVARKMVCDDACAQKWSGIAWTAVHWCATLTCIWHMDGFLCIHIANAIMRYYHLTWQ